jgi:predicted MFS family arabinose efflux permease
LGDIFWGLLKDYQKDRFILFLDPDKDPLGGGYHPSASPLISTFVAEKGRGNAPGGVPGGAQGNALGSALGIHQIGGSASFFLAPLIAGGIGEALGWRGAFLVVSAPTLLLGILLYLLLERGGEREGGDESRDGESGENPAGRLGSIFPVMLLNVLNQFTVYTVLTFVPLYVVDRLGGSKAAGAALLSIAHSAGLWAGPLGGVLSDRIGKVPIIVAAGFLAAPLIYLLGHASLAWSVYPILLFMGMSQYLGMPVTESYVITHAPRKTRSTLLGVYYTLSRGGPGLAAPVIGYLIDRYGFATALPVTAAFMGAVAVGFSIPILLSAGRGER